MSVCRYKNKVVLLVYDELSDTERAELDAHLKVCAACRQELAALRQFSSGVPSMSVDDDILKPTRRALFYKLRSASIESQRSQSISWGMKLALQAGLAIALIFFGFQLGHQKTNSSQSAFAVQDLLTAQRTISVDDGTISPQLAGVDKITFNPDGTIEISYNTFNKVHLEGRGDDPAVQQMLQYALLMDDDPIARRRAVKTVQQLVNTDVDLEPIYIEALGHILNDEENLGVKLNIIDILGHAASQPQAQELLIRLMLHENNEAVRIRAFRALVQDRRQFDNLESILSATKSDSNTFIRTKSLELLNQNKGTSL